MPTPYRDPVREQAFFENAAPGRPRFISHAQGRLALGEQKFGDAWTRLELEKFIAEIREEAVDLAAWSALMLQSLESALESMPVTIAPRIAAQLSAIAHQGVCVYDTLDAIEHLAGITTTAESAT